MTGEIMMTQWFRRIVAALVIRATSGALVAQSRIQATDGAEQHNHKNGEIR